MTNKNQSGQTKRPIANNDSFLEALRGLGRQAAVNPQSGEIKPNQSVDFDDFQRQEERLERQKWGFQQDYLDLRKREQIIWTKKEEDVKQQINTVLSELKQIAASTKNLAKEITIAAAQAPVEAGTYHLNFFEKLRLALVELKKRVEESATWLAAFNQKSKKRNYYWAQFKKSGTKYTLSADRYMATQVG